MPNKLSYWNGDLSPFDRFNDQRSRRRAAKQRMISIIVTAMTIIIATMIAVGGTLYFCRGH